MSGYYDHFGEYHKDESDSAGWEGLKGREQIIPRVAFPLPANPAAVALVETNTDPTIGAALLDLAKSDKEAEIVSIVIRPPFPTNNNASPAQLIATLQWGVFGTYASVDFDVLRGTTISLLASTVRLFVRQQMVRAQVAPPFPVDISLGAFFSRGAIARTPRQVPQFTVPYAAGVPLGVLGTHSYLLPQFAKSVRIVAVPNNAQLNVTLNSGAGIWGAFYTVVAYPSAELIIPAQSDIINVYNPGPVVVTDYSLVFDLDI